MMATTSQGLDRYSGSGRRVAIGTRHRLLDLFCGADSKCRVTPPVGSITLHKVTAVMGASDEAVEAWLARPWSQS